MAKLIPLSEAAQKTKVSAAKIQAAAERGAFALVTKACDREKPMDERPLFVRVSDLPAIHDLRAAHDEERVPAPVGAAE